jgi:hypothetical protein
MTEPQNEGWYIYHGMKDPVGPVATESIVDAIRAGKFPLDANVCRPGDRRWVPVITVPEFASAVRDAAPKPAVNSLPPPSFGASQGLDSRWSVRNDGRESWGQLSTEQMVEQILNGGIPLTATVNRAGSETWVTLRDIPLFALAARVVRNRENAPARSDDAEKLDLEDQD